MNFTLIGIIIFFAAFMANRFIMTGATRELTDELKLKLFDVFSKRNNYFSIFLLIMVVVYFAVIQTYPYRAFIVTIIYLVVFVTFLIAKFISNYKKLKQIEVPQKYMSSFFLSCGIFMLGFVGLFLCALLDFRY